MRRRDFFAALAAMCAGAVGLRRARAAPPALGDLVELRVVVAPGDRSMAYMRAMAARDHAPADAWDARP